MSAVSTTKPSSQSDVQNMDRNNLDDIYETLGLIGKGVFGKVMKCLNKETGEIVAVKRLNNTKNVERAIRRELAMLNAIRTLDPDTNNIVKFFQYFKSLDGLHFMEFEMLDLSVQDLMKKQKPFSLNEIRPMAKQLLVALEGLQKVGVMHTDIKPDNIMLVDHQNQPFKVKLIDFGMAMHTSDAKIGMKMQPLVYRAPEVTLGLPLSEAVDMWSLGCCLMEWYLSVDPFEGFCLYDHLQKIIHLIGVPDNDLLQQAAFTNVYFTEEGLGWRLKTPSEYEHTKGVEPETSKNCLSSAEDLEDVIKNFYGMESGLEFEDRLAFLDLLKKMFNLNPEKRITPTEALKHPFITREHLTSNIGYLELSKRLLTYTPTQDAPTDLRMGSNESSPGQVLTSSSSVTPENSTEDTSFDSSSASFSGSSTNTTTSNSLGTDDNNNPDNIYEMLGCVGVGLSGILEKCLNKQTGEIVTVKRKMITKNMHHVIQKELAMLNAIGTLDPDANNIVKFFQHFKSRDGRFHFMEFEMLDQSVLNLMKKQQIPFSLNKIRSMAKQLLVALEGLRRVGVIHTDIEPNNIMLVDHQNQPFKVKLLDSGRSMHTSDAKIGMRIQPLECCVTEVTLGLPLSEAVDMWSLGCCLMEWYLLVNPFEGFCPYDHLQKIIHLIGVPDNDLLQQAAFANEYFIEEGLGWRLKTPSEYEHTKGVKPKTSKNCLDVAEDLEDVIKNFSVMESGLEFEDRLAFLDLLKKMFNLNPEKRITPTEALKHPFITSEHLTPTQAAPTDLRIGQTPEISSSKSIEPPSATSEKVNEDSARPDCKPKNQRIIGPITVQNDERPLPPSVEHEAASQHPNQGTDNEEQTDTETSNASDTAALHPIRPLSELEDTKPHQNIPCRVVTTKIRIEYQQSGTFRRRTTRIATKRCQ